MDIHTKEFISANILKAEAGTTGLCGGDSGHGGRTYFALEDLSGTDISFKVSEGRIEVKLGGDSELVTVTNALKFITEIFEESIRKTIGGTNNESTKLQQEQQKEDF